jgi:hypothetical protein
MGSGATTAVTTGGETANYGREAANAGRDTGTPARETANYGRETAILARETANYGRETAIPARETANYGREAATPARETANYGRETAILARETANYGRDTANYGRESANYGREEAPPTERVPERSSMPPVSEPKPSQKPAQALLGTPIYVLSGGHPIEPAPSSLDVLVEFEDPISLPRGTHAEPPPVSEPAMSVHDVHLVPNSEPDFGANAESEFDSEPPSTPAHVAQIVPPSSNPPPSEHEAQVVSENPTQIFLASRMPPEVRRAIDRGHETDRPPGAMITLRPRVARAAGGYPYIPEEVETLALPGGLSDEQLAEGVAARNGDEVRIVSTRFARTVGRDYREKYGVKLRMDAQAIESMQRHLIAKWGALGLNSPEATWDVRRHGALLSEILARTLDAEWVDVAPSEIGYWAMFVPPRTRTWPFGRVYRFLTLGHREKDLVSYYLDLVARARDGA